MPSWSPSRKQGAWPILPAIYQPTLSIRMAGLERYNTAWLVTEDLGPLIPSLSDSPVVTPNLSRLAAKELRLIN